VIDQAIDELSPIVGVKAACQAVGRPRGIHYRHHRQSPPTLRRERVPSGQPRAGTGGNETHNLHNIVVDGRVVAQINRSQAASGGMNPVSGVTYLHNDLQGSTVALTNRNGEPTGDDGSWLRELFYDPFGRRIDAQNDPLGDSRRGGPRQGYTGHEHDDEFGLINMQGRIYDPEARRFLTPDPIQAPVSSQTYNRYSYVQNNPATLTDPTGYLPPGTDLLSGPALPRQPGWDVCFSSLTDDDCGFRQAAPVEADPFRESELALRARSAGLSVTPTATPAAPTPSADDRARPTVKVSEQSAVFKADGSNVAILTKISKWLAKSTPGKLVAMLLEVGIPGVEGRHGMSRQGMSIGYDQEGKTEIMTKKQAMGKSTAPRTKGGKLGGGGKIGRQGGSVRIGVLGKIAAAAAAALAAVAIYKGCKSGSCTRGVADAALTAAGAPVTWTEARELSRTPEGRAEFQEAIWGTILDEKGQGGARWW
jgi:RHS repeat-associated protein